MKKKSGNGLYNSRRNFLTQKNRDHIPVGAQNKKRAAEYRMEWKTIREPFTLTTTIPLIWTASLPLVNEKYMQIVTKVFKFVVCTSVSFFLLQILGPAEIIATEIVHQLKGHWDRIFIYLFYVQCVCVCFLFAGRALLTSFQSNTIPSHSFGRIQLI